MFIAPDTDAVRSRAVVLLLLGLGLLATTARAQPPPDRQSLERPAEGRTLVLGQPVAALSAGAATNTQHVFFVTMGTCARVGVWRLTKTPQVFDLPGDDCAYTPYGLALARWATVRSMRGRDVYEVWEVEQSEPWLPYLQPRRLVRRSVAAGSPAPILFFAGGFWVNGRLVRGYAQKLARPPVGVSADGSYVALSSADGTVALYTNDSSKGGKLTRVPYRRDRIIAVKDFGLVLLPGRLERINPLGQLLGSFDLPLAASYGDAACYRPACRPTAALRLADNTPRYAVYLRGKEIHVVDLRLRMDRVLLRVAARVPVQAQLEEGGLTYSHDNRITYVPLRRIQALFR